MGVFNQRNGITKGGFTMNKLEELRKERELIGARLLNGIADKYDIRRLHYVLEEIAELEAEEE